MAPAARVAGAATGGGVLLAVAVVLVALNLRPAITSVGPVLGEARDALGASATWAGVLTTIPGLCFAAAGMAAPLLARRAGTTVAVALAMAVLAAGLVVRVLGGPLVVLGGTMVATAGIALANVLVPVVVKDSFPARVGLMTGTYTAALQVGGALGSAATAPVGEAFGGWRAGLASWAVLAVAALAVWLVAARVRRRAIAVDAARTGAERSRTGDAQPPRSRSLLRSPLAWVVTVFFGLQAWLAYVMMGWLPEVLIDSGVPQARAGLLVGALSVVGVPVSLAIPVLAARRTSQSGWIVGLGVIGLAGMVGLMLAPAAAPLLWTLLVGLGMGVFSLALTVIALRARTIADTARLSGMAQGFGYLLAAVGPFLFGLLHDVTAGWTVPFAMLIAVLLTQMTFGWFAGRPRYV
ncbi:MFS transporter [Haloechinothrix sp. LS1_15]|uniref:MFS transporter n=1 Tax=Haloechinothrix sp. LS1_15 TaxID=2652248 RepID=UPI00294B404F|nr:MFS transporter [Haloechinothrix sp. LS1_15]